MQISGRGFSSPIQAAKRIRALWPFHHLALRYGDLQPPFIQAQAQAKQEPGADVDLAGRSI